MSRCRQVRSKLATSSCNGIFETTLHSLHNTHNGLLPAPTCYTLATGKLHGVMNFGLYGTCSDVNCAERIISIITLCVERTLTHSFAGCMPIMPLSVNFLGHSVEASLWLSQWRWCLLQRLHSSDAARRHEYSLHDSRRPEYRSRNRYRDVVPCKYIYSYNFNNNRVNLVHFVAQYSFVPARRTSAELTLEAPAVARWVEIGTSSEINRVSEFWCEFKGLIGSRGFDSEREGVVLRVQRCVKWNMCRALYRWTKYDKIGIDLRLLEWPSENWNEKLLSYKSDCAERGNRKMTDGCYLETFICRQWWMRLKDARRCTSTRVAVSDNDIVWEGEAYLDSVWSLRTF